MDLLHVLKEWMPLLSPVIFLAGIPLLHWIVGSTLASKTDLAALAAKTHADHDEESDKIGDLDTRLSVVENKLVHIDTSLAEVATKRDVSDIREWIRDIKAQLTRIDRHLMKDAGG